MEGDIPFPFYSLPPKSGLNRMSYPFISLSTVSFTRGILLGSLISLTLGREEREKKIWWCNAEELINITRQSRFFFFFESGDNDTRRHETGLPLGPHAGDK